jgi:dTDP-4-dehydrorhamnose reductase
LDIKNLNTLTGVNTIIHCAAYTNVLKAETDKQECYKVNVEGTYNLIYANKNKACRFIYISTEYIYEPVNFYTYTKMWAEEIVKRFCPNHLIIRTLFKERPFQYDYAFYDQYTNGDYVDVIAPAIVTEIMNGTRGTMDIGTGKKTIIELARQSKPDINGISVNDVIGVKLPKGVNLP